MPRIRVTAKQLGDRHFQINLSNRIAVITQSLLKPGKGGRKARVKAAYFGFPDHDSAQVFANNIRGRFPKARIQVRTSERLDSPIEVKISGDFVERLAWELVYSSESTGQRIQRHLQVVASRPSIEPDQPSTRWANAATKPRHTGRETVTTRSGRTLSIN